MLRIQPLARTVALTLALATAAVGMTALPAAAATKPSPGGFSVDKLADSSSQQQRWLSLPKSRLTLNPGRDVTPSPIDTLNTAYFAGGAQRTANNVVSNGLSTSAPIQLPAVDGGDLSPAFSDQFAAAGISQWSATDASLAASDHGGVLSLNQGASDPWGHVTHDVSVDVSKDSVLTIDVASLVGAGTQWSLTLGKDGSNVDTLQANTTQTGTLSYDLSGVTASFNQVQLWVAGTRGASQVTFTGISIHAAPAFDDQFTATSVAQWASSGATLTSGSGGGVLSLAQSAPDPWGNVSRPVTIDVSKNPMLTIDVASLVGAGTQWSLTLGKNGSNVDTLQANTTQTGIFSYDLSGVTASFNQVQLWVNGTRGSSAVVFQRLSITYNVPTKWLTPASTVSNTWNPQSLDYSATYGTNGTYTTKDVFVDADTVARIVSPALSSGAPTLYGDLNGSAQWDSSNRVLTVSTADYTRAVAFPAGATVYFFGGAIGINPLDEPTGALHWAAVLPANSASSIGFGYAVSGDGTAIASAQQRARNGAVVATATAALTKQTSLWNGVIAKVPAAKNYTLNAVDAKGVTAAQIQAMYYNAFVSLEMNVLPATPENGSTHAQMPVGKADTYYSPEFTYNTLSASWDGPLALQDLAYIDPSTAWDIFIGMMSAVRNDPGQSDDGQFGTASEALPARIAQTAWVLYSVTGNKDALASIYPALQRFLAWSSQHPQWNNTSHYPNQTYPDGVHATWQDERDAEFVASLAVDYTFAQNIATTLGKSTDVTAFATAQRQVVQQYSDWFFPNGNAAEFYWGHLGLQGGWPVSAGTTPDAILTGLLVPGLTEAQKTALLNLFNSVYNPYAQFAGIGTETAGLKAPDEQYMLEGLITVGKPAAAEGFLQAVIRDQTIAHIFSENYNASPSGPVGNGERPSTFGISQMIDNIWKMNGYDMDQGTPGFVKLPHTVGGVSGLTYLGKSLNVDVTNSGITISGDAAVPSSTCTQYNSTSGQIQPISSKCGR